MECGSSLKRAIQKEDDLDGQTMSNVHNANRLLCPADYFADHFRINLRSILNPPILSLYFPQLLARRLQMTGIRD